MDRREKLLSGLNLATSRGIEIGPLDRPVIDKAENQVLYVDHTDTEGLRRNYASDPNVNVDYIRDIDGVWGEQSLKDCLGGRTDFDYVIASHVVEHVPDLVAWLGEVHEVLRPGGLLCLAIPDRRYTFDYSRRLSDLADVIDAFVLKKRKPTPVQIFDCLSKAAPIDLNAVWEGRMDPRKLKPNLTKREVLDLCVQVTEQDLYRDIHCWVVTPSSLLGIFADLVDLDLLAFRCASFFPTEPYEAEFFLTLEKLKPEVPPSDAKAEARQSFLDAHSRLGEIEKLGSDLSPLTAMSKLETLDAELRQIKARRVWRYWNGLRIARRKAIARIGDLRATGRRFAKRVFGS